MLGKPSGPIDAPICLIGRDWGFEEQAAQRSFVGASGRTLDRALTKAGIERGKCLVSNVVNARPANNRWEAHHATDIAAGVEALHTLLALHPRKLVVALGAEAFQACRGVDVCARPESEFDGNGITELRGYVFEGPFGPVLAATHPAFVLRTWLPWWPLLCWDLGKAARIVNGVVGKGETQEYVFDGGPPYALTSADTLAVDIETVGDHAEQIKCIAFAANGQEGWVTHFWPSNRDAIAELLAGPAHKVFHNGQFDVTILERHGFTVRNWTDDTMLMWHCVEPLLAGKKKESGDQTQKSLRFLASLLLDEPWWKLYNYSTEEDQLRLCARDARITFAVWQKLRGRLEAVPRV